MALTNTDFDAIMRIYSDRQLNNRRSLDARRAEAYARFPRLREIAEEIASLSVKKAKAALGAGYCPPERLPPYFGRWYG